MGFNPLSLIWFGLTLLMAAGPTLARAPRVEIPSGPLTLEQCIALAVEHSDEVVLARRAVEISRADALGSWAQVLPTVSATLGNMSRSVSGDRLLQQDVPVGADPATGAVRYERRQIAQTGRTLDSFSGSVYLSQPLFDGGRGWQIIRQSRTQERMARQDLRAAQQGVRRTVAQQYYALLQAERLRQVAAEAVQRSQEQSKNTQALFEVGTVPRIDLLRARAALGNDQVDLVQREQAVSAARAELTTTLGLDARLAQEFVLTEDLQIEETTWDEQELQARARNTNSSVQRARVEAEVARMGLGSARSGAWPQISGNLSYSRSGSGAGAVYGDWQRNWNVAAGVSAQVTLFSGFQQRAAVQRAREVRGKADEGLEQSERQLVLGIHKTLLELRTQMQVIIASRDNVSLSQEDLHLAQEQYGLGVGTLSEVIDVQAELTRSRSALVQAQCQYKTAEAELAWLLGE